MKYTKTHEWVKTEDNVAFIGVTDYAQNEMGDIVYVDMPEPGDEAEIGKSICELESVKAVAPVESPVKGIVVAVNDDVDGDPALVNNDAFGTWLVKVQYSKLSDELMNEDEYNEYIKTL